MVLKNYTPIDALLVSKPKEVEPIPSSPEKIYLQEVVEHKPGPEVAPFVTHREETVLLPTELEQIGAEKVINPKFPAYQDVKTPISDEKVLSGRHAPVSSPLRWLSALAEYILRQAHLTLKVIHGKVIRRKA